MLLVTFACSHFFSWIRKPDHSVVDFPGRISNIFNKRFRGSVCCKTSVKFIIINNVLIDVDSGDNVDNDSDDDVDDNI